MAKSVIRECGDGESDRILDIVNAAAEAYRGVIPPDHWHEPYMSAAQLEKERAAGILFWGWEEDGELIGVMGIQSVRDVDLIRHAYVLPGRQGGGVGGGLLRHLRQRSGRPILIGTWAAASWAIAFYRRHGFEPVPPEIAPALLRSYWEISESQIESSIVLADPPVRERPAG
jgi:GNAT superfamily N-acetyltransferase